MKKKMQFALVGGILTAAIILVGAEAADGSFPVTAAVKGAGVILLATVPILWRRFRLGDHPAVRRFTDYD